MHGSTFTAETRKQKQMKKMLTKIFISAVSIVLIGALPLSAQFNRADKKSSNPYTTQYQRIEAGSYHTLEIRNGQLWAWGDNFHGQLGNGTQSASFVPIQVGTDEDWLFVSAGSMHNLALKADGTLWAWGDNSYGQLGDGTYNMHLTPQQVGSANDWISVSAGSTHSLALKADGTLWAWGNNGNGQLGDGSNAPSNIPIQIGSGNTWAKIAAGGYFTLAAKVDGTVWSWGNNAYGQLGDGTTNNHASPAQISGLTDCRTLVAGETNSFVIEANGQMFRFGDNSYSQLGDGTTTSRSTPTLLACPSGSGWVTVAPGIYHTVAIGNDGMLYAWGNNAYGQFGNGLTASSATPLAVATAFNQVAVTAGYAHTMVLLSDGHVWGNGYNVQGELGNGSNIDSWWRTDLRPPTTAWVKVSSGYGQTVALRDNGTLWSWGYNASGELGIGNNTSQYSPVQIGTDNDWVSIAAGSTHTLATKANGTLWATGSNILGALGDGTFTNQNVFIQITATHDWASVTAGEEYSFAIKYDGTLWSWGMNTYGELGQGTNSTLNIPTQVDTAHTWTCVRAGGHHTLALRGDGSMWSTGNDSNGQLGNGAGGPANTFGQVGSGIIGIAAGRDHSFGISVMGQLGAWGKNVSTQLGDNTSTDRQTPVLIDPAHLWIDISAGYDHSIGITSSGTIGAWGSGSLGQLGDGTNVQYAVPTFNTSESNVLLVSCGASHTCLIKNTRSSICVTGNNGSGQLGTGSTISTNLFSCSVSVCIAPDLPVIAATDSTLCPGESTQLSIVGGSLHDAIQWNWYTGSCGGTPVGTGLTLTVTPSATETYYVRGEGACTTPGNCTQFTVNVIPVNINNTISVSMDTFMSNQPGATYQWVNCNTGQFVAGATSQTFIPAVNGDYGVIVTMSTCADTSSCVFIGDVGTPEYTQSAISIAPNPGTEHVTVQANTIIQSVKMFDVLGNVVYSSATSTNATIIDLSTIAKGVYFLEVKTADGITTSRFVKE